MSNHSWALPLLVCVAASTALTAQADAATPTASHSAEPVSTTKPLVFESVFSPAGEPATLHFKAIFTARSTGHQLEVWRDRDRRVKRLTDQAFISYAVHKPGDANFDLQMLDLRKRISTHIDRTTMYRLGNFTDWFDLTHGLRHPKGPYTLARSADPALAVAPVAACDWYTLAQNGRATRLCWSRASRLPLVILAADGTPAWRVTAVDARVPADAFTIADKGFVHVDAVKDAERD